MNTREESKLREVLDAASKQELADLIMRHCKVDTNFRRQLLGSPAAPKEDAQFAHLKKRLDDVIRGIDNYDDYYYYDEGDPIGEAVDDIVQSAKQRAERGEADLALQMVAYAVREAVSIDGGEEYDYEWDYLPDSVAEAIRAVDAQTVGDSGFRARWTEKLLGIAEDIESLYASGADTVLAAIVPFAEESMKDTFRERAEHLPNHTYSMLAITRQFDGEEAADSYMRAHLENDVYREMLVQMARDEGRFSEAEELCLERIASDSKELGIWYSKKHEWEQRLYETYGQAGEKKKQAELGAKMVAAGDTTIYAEVKTLLQDVGQWEQTYPGLLDSIGKHAPTGSYMDILASENETRLLMNVLEKRSYPTDIFKYGSILYPVYPEKTIALVTPIIESDSGSADNRKAYNHLASELREFADMGAGIQALSLLDDICARYPRKRALQEELHAVRKHVAEKAAEADRKAAVSRT